MPAASSALRAAVPSSKRKCATPSPLTTHAAPPSMLTSARPRAAPISARAPGRFSKAIVKSFMEPPPVGLHKMHFHRASLLHLFDLRQGNRVGTTDRKSTRLNSSHL